MTTLLTTVTYRRHISRWPRDGGALWVYGRYKWAESATSQWRTFEVIPSDASSVTVYSLQPGSTYMFTVLARTASSQPTVGLFSRVVNASTKGLSAVIYYCYYYYILFLLLLLVGATIMDLGQSPQILSL